ncbi:MAG: 50S ribosomal protein L25/general stress protein Ctc [Rhodomicrobium sp.]|nr:50S ribosomal protein L25/general stress protein Ctc [Rhodomicrobium sp.]
MAEMVELKAESRAATGSSAAGKLRKEGLIPAIIYGGAQQPQNITIARKDVWRQVETGHFLSTVYMLDVNGEKIRVIPRDVQLDPVRDFPLHVDFLRVSKTSRIDVEVQVYFKDEEKSPGLKRGGVLNIVRHAIELTCPADSIPESIEVSLAGLDIGDAIHISAIALPANVKPTIADRDFTIATIVPSSAMKPEAEEGVAPTEEGSSE